jgi:hypothetical protein
MLATTGSHRLGTTVAGAVAALAWAAAQPLDKAIVRHGYDDVELLGRAVRPAGGWRLPGLALHAANGAVFGLAYSELRRRTPNTDPLITATAAALVEHVTLFPLGALVDQHHPAKEQLARTWSLRAFIQATWRHLLFGLVLGLLVREIEKRS